VWRQHVLEPEAWARQHTWLIDTIYAEFERTGDWPTVETVQRRLADEDTMRAVAVAQLAIDIPAEIGARNGQQLTLTARALSHCEAAAGLLAQFVAAIRLAVESYRVSDTDHPPMLSGFAVKERLQLDEATYAKLSTLLSREPWFFAGMGGNHDDDGTIRVRVEVLLAEDIETIGDYLDAVAQMRFPEPGRTRPIVSLQNDWEIGAPIGSGGFGRVMHAICEGQQAAAKFIPKAPGAERELLFVELRGVRNVVPIIDHGETEEEWVLVMPLAERSLREHLEQLGPALTAEQTREILTDVASTLADLDGEVVHRDLKPENVLLLDGHWCLADFGISRYAEATTATDTHKYAMTPAYAAPERWREERATGAADVYALGVMAHEMLAGQRPFPGPTREDYREQHLRWSAPALEHVHPALAALTQSCLLKAPEARPSAVEALARLGHAGGTRPSAGLARLSEASRAHATEQADQDRQSALAGSENERRAALAGAARAQLERMILSMCQDITAAAPTVVLAHGADGARSITLGPAELSISPIADQLAADDGLTQGIAFDVVASAKIGVGAPPDHYGYVGRSHSLWFCDAHEQGRYGWFETAFMLQPMLAQQSAREPFALDPGREAAQAIGPGVGTRQVAWPFTRLDDATLPEFTSRWAALLADGAQGALHRPTTVPEHEPQGSWRKQ
jgi:serine/threonine-protein kinase